MHKNELFYINILKNFSIFYTFCHLLTFYIYIIIKHYNYILRINKCNLHLNKFLSQCY